MSDEIPFLSLGQLHAPIRAELRAAFDAVVDASAFIGGAAVSGFEAELASAHGRSHAVGCASGTDALALALHALGVGPGDEVILPAMTFIATAEAVVHVGATPVIADVDPSSLLLAPAAVDAVRTDRTRAVLPVHLYGHLVPFDHLRMWRESGLVVVEDAAQAHLGRWRGEGVGSVGQAACFSFYPGKNLGAMGDAGAVVTDDPHVAAAVRRRRDHGRTDKYLHEEIGVASRLDALQAALLRVKLAHLQAWTERRREVAERYRRHLTSGPVRLVPWEDGAVHHLLCVRVDAERRDDLRGWLTEAGIGSGIHYPVDLSQQPATAPFAPAACPAASAAAAELVSLPMGPHLTDDQVDRVCARLLAFG
jgi:dTDP-4-amino-4,6-dideoxygalactose transaminase